LRQKCTPDKILATPMQRIYTPSVIQQLLRYLFAMAIAFNETHTKSRTVTTVPSLIKQIAMGRRNYGSRFSHTSCHCQTIESVLCAFFYDLLPSFLSEPAEINSTLTLTKTLHFLGDFVFRPTTGALLLEPIVLSQTHCKIRLFNRFV